MLTQRYGTPCSPYNVLSVLTLAKVLRAHSINGTPCSPKGTPCSPYELDSVLTHPCFHVVRCCHGRRSVLPFPPLINLLSWDWYSELLIYLSPNLPWPTCFFKTFAHTDLFALCFAWFSSLLRYPGYSLANVLGAELSFFEYAYSCAKRNKLSLCEGRSLCEELSLWLCSLHGFLQCMHIYHILV